MCFSPSHGWSWGWFGSSWRTRRYFAADAWPISKQGRWDTATGIPATPHSLQGISRIMCASTGATGANLTAGTKGAGRGTKPLRNRANLWGQHLHLKCCHGASPMGAPRNPISPEQQLHRPLDVHLSFIPHIPKPAFNPRPFLRIKLAPKLWAWALCFVPSLQLLPVQHFSGSSASFWPCL